MRITEQKWDELFVAVYDGDELVEFEATDPDFPAAKAFAEELAEKPEDWEKHFWTTADDGEFWRMSNGFWRADRMKFCFSKKPWTCERGDIIVYDDYQHSDGDLRENNCD